MTWSPQLVSLSARFNNGIRFGQENTPQIYQRNLLPYRYHKSDEFLAADNQKSRI